MAASGFKGETLASKLLLAAKPPPGRAKELLQASHQNGGATSASPANGNNKKNSLTRSTSNRSVVVPATDGPVSNGNGPRATPTTEGDDPSKRTAGTLKVPEQKHGRASEVIVTTDDGVDSRSGTALSRRDSADSRLSGASTVDFSKLLPMQALGGNERGNEDDQDNAITSSDSYIRSAIPCLPLSFAIVCLILNTCLPGFGTIVSGMSIFCCGKPRIHTKDDSKTTTFCVNIWVGISQLFTVPFLLVGWFWSFVWGIYMVIIAAEHRRELKEQREKELQAKALSAFSSQFRPWALKT